VRSKKYGGCSSTKNASFKAAETLVSTKRILQLGEMKPGWLALQGVQADFISRHRRLSKLFESL